MTFHLERALAGCTYVQLCIFGIPYMIDYNRHYYSVIIDSGLTLPHFLSILMLFSNSNREQQDTQQY